MSFANCPRCHHIFRKSPENKICAACQTAEDAAYTKVANWLSDHPGATLREVAEATEVEERIISRLIREGRLTLLENLHADDQPRCRRCDVRITRGTMCPTCAQTFSESVTDSVRSLMNPSDKRIHPVRGPLNREEKRKWDSSS